MWKHVPTVDYEEDGIQIIHTSLRGVGVVRACHIYRGQLDNTLHTLFVATVEFEDQNLEAGMQSM